MPEIDSHAHENLSILILYTSYPFLMLLPLFCQVRRFPRLAVLSFPKLLSTKTRITAKSASGFTQDEVDLLRVKFQPASFEDVIPTTKDPVTVPNEYLLPEINRRALSNADFDVEKLDKVSNNRVKTFIVKMHDVVMNEKVATGTLESKTDTLVDDLLRVAELNDWPLKLINYPLCRLFIKEKKLVLADPEFVIANRNLSMVAIEDKHIKNVWNPSGFGETQIAVQIVACGNENIRSTSREEFIDQTIFAMRVISTYVTFYKAVIPAEYWSEFKRGLPKEASVNVKRWPGVNGKQDGLDLVEPDGRREVLGALTKIRQFLLRNEQSAKNLGDETSSTSIQNVTTNDNTDSSKEKLLKSCSEKVRPKVPLEQNSQSVLVQKHISNPAKLSDCEVGQVQALPEETKVSHNYIVAQDFIQEVSSRFTDEDIIEVIDGNLILTTNTTIEVELAHLFLKVSIEGKNTIQAKQKEISCRYSYGKRFEMEVQELMAEKNKWAMGCFREDLERDMRFYRGGIERKEDPRKYREFLTDRDRLIGEELLRRGILKSGLSTAWLDDLMEEWEKIHIQFIQIFNQNFDPFEEKTLFVPRG
ncbi:1130_t:CDS:2 [Ambispora leptoticha]|uniref:1130_t:CDS:1 n=1 Tax=Ambispora leptoticha TaxID=144679 RepID=A0A9N9F501_9GLOM|nr:1130_t:CDS:2 [Ambispora leptoticha]